MNSCLFEGRVKHRRSDPVAHRFSYRLFFVYLDLEELDTVFDGHWLWSTKGWAPARFRRSDHVGDPSVPLDATVRDLVAADTGWRPSGPIRLLTHLRYFGYCFNPVSFYYCFDDDDESVECIVAEVSNTPWGERCCYVLPRSDSIGANAALRFCPSKKMHVSPFMDMDIQYDWSFTEPGDRLNVFMANSRDGKRFFDASIALERREIGTASLAGVLIKYPLLTSRVIVGIYWQALLLWLKRCPFVGHPSKRQALTAKQ